MRAVLSIATALSALIVACCGPQPASAGGLLFEDGYRSNFVYRFGAPRATYRVFSYRMHDHLYVGPRYTYRLRREGFEFQRGHRGEPTVVESRETLK